MQHAINRFGSTESSISRDRDSDDENWEQKENTRTHSVKFTEEMPELKEVSLCCCNLFRTSNKRKGPLITKYAYKHSRFVPTCFHSAGITVREGWRNVGSWFRTHVRETCSRHRAYVALSTILVALE